MRATSMFEILEPRLLLSWNWSDAGSWVQGPLSMSDGTLQNEAPTNITLSRATILENRPAGTPVGTFSSTDLDLTDTFTYALVDGSGATDNAAFETVGNELRSAAPFDYETKASYSIRVETTDQGGLSYQKVFTISVADLSEAPTDITIKPGSVVEDQPVGAIAGYLYTADPDYEPYFTYSLIAGEGATDNSSFVISGRVLKTAEVFNRATKDTYSIRVRTTDSQWLSFEKSIVISVVPRDAYVDTDSPGPIHDGLSWATAYDDLSLAIASAARNSRILVADGTYRPTLTADRSVSFQLAPTVSILGGYAGYGANDPDARDMTGNPTILSGNIGSPSSNTDNSLHVVSGSSVDSTATLDGFTIREGYNEWTSTAIGYGAGILIKNGSPSILNCILAANIARYGGALYIGGSSSSPVLGELLVHRELSGMGRRRRGAQQPGIA